MDDEMAGQRILLGLLLEKGNVSLGEICRDLGWDEVRVEDSLAALTRTGLAHRQGEFAFASLSAARATELTL